MKLKKWVKILAAVLLLWFISHIAYVFSDGLDEPGIADVAVVLGNKVNEDGTLSPRLKARLDEAYTLFTLNRVKGIIVSGGLGKEGFYEGDKMKEYLVKKGIPDSLMIVDNKGNNTEATVENTKIICKERGFKSVIVVSQWFHITRTKYMFRKSGLAVKGAAPNYFEWRDFYAVTREFFAFYAYLL